MLENFLILCKFKSSKIDYITSSPHLKFDVQKSKFLSLI
eukprot:UN11934